MSQRHRHLDRQLRLSGRDPVCEVAGCGLRTRLEIHHIMPVACGGDDAVSNLAYVCRQHHALVERYYWWRRRELDPDTAKEIESISRGFASGRIPALLVGPMSDRTKALWAKLNTICHCQNPSWWQRVFDEALAWASDLEILREVSPGQAIVEEPWFRTRNKAVGGP